MSRILFTTCPAYGHLLPMLPLAGAARRAGHEVVIASGAEMAGEIERHGFTYWQAGPSRAQADARFRAKYPELVTLAEDERVRTAVNGMFLPTAVDRAVDLVPLAAEWKPDLVVHEMGELAGPVAAAQVGARHAMHGLSQLPPGFWPLFAPGFARMCSHWDVPELADGLLDAPYLDICPPALQPGGPADVRHVQPLRPDAGVLPPGAGLGFDPSALPYPDTVYLTLGTIFHQMPGVLRAALAGLRELPVNVIVTVGPGANPDLLGPQPPHVVVVDYVPQALVLPHCRLVVSHGGSGSISGALCHGLAQLILPQGADNFTGAGACQRAGAALTLEPQQVDAAAVAKAAGRLLAEPGFGAAARRIQAEIDAMPDADTVLAILLADER